MRNRDLIIQKIEHLEGKMNTLRTQLNGSYPLNEFLNNIEISKDIISEVKSLIEREPRTPEELNYLNR